MSVRAITAVWDHSASEGIERLVAIALADHADDRGICWPGEKGLARKCKVSERTIRRALVSLRERNELIIVKTGRHNVYALLLPGLLTPDKLTAVVNGKAVTLSKTPDTDGRSDRTQLWPPNRKEPSLTAEEEQAISKARAEIRSVLGKESV